MGQGREEMEGAEASYEPAVRKKRFRESCFSRQRGVLSAVDCLLPVPQAKERSLVPQRAGFSEVVRGSAPPNSAVVFSLAFGISDAGRRASALWQMCWN